MRFSPDQLEKILDAADIGIWQLHVASGLVTRSEVIPRILHAQPADLGADRVGILRGPAQCHAQPALARLIDIQLCCAAVLRNAEVHTAIVIEVGEGGAALFAVNFDTHYAPINRREAAVPVATQPQASSAVIAGNRLSACVFRHGAKTILAEKYVFVPVGVVVSHVNREDRCELRLAREGDPVETSATVEKNA